MKRKFIYVFAIIVVVAFGLKIQEKGLKNIINEFYIENQEKKLLKEINRKISSKKFTSLLEELKINDLKTVNYLTNRESLREGLNESNAKKISQRMNSKDLTLEEAEQILVLSRELVSLQNLSLKLKQYIKSIYRDFDYEYFALEGDKLISVIRDKEYIYQSIPEALKSMMSELDIVNLIEIRKILGEKNVSQNNIESYKKFSSLELPLEEMENIYVLSQILTKIEDLNPKVTEKLKALYPDLDYRKITFSGKYYIEDRQSIDTIDREYSTKGYTFTNPYIRINPYGRVINSAIVKYPESEKDLVTVTVIGSQGKKDLSYKVEKKKEIPIFGLLLGQTNVVTINNGKKEVKIPITIVEKIPNELPYMKVNNLENILNEELINMVYYNINSKYSITLDKDGDIRYLFSFNKEKDTKESLLEKTQDGVVYYGKEYGISFTTIGKVKDDFLVKEYLKNNQQSILNNEDVSIITIPFKNENYPKGEIIKRDNIKNKDIYTVEVYFDFNDDKLNRISDGKELNSFY